MVKEYRICIIDGKPKKVIVENGEVVNRNPSKEELKGLNEEYYIRKFRHDSRGYTENELLDILKEFYIEYGRVPVSADFNVGNSLYPSTNTYVKRFGNWSRALKLVELDVESMIKKGIVNTSNQKARLSEIIVRNHFKKYSIDLAGENCKNPFDGICPNGMKYDVKSARLNKTFYQFVTDNEYKDEIEIYYLLAFNEDYTKLNYGWRVPGDIIESTMFYVGTSWANFTIDNMKEYDITDRIIGILKEM